MNFDVEKQDQSWKELELKGTKAERDWSKDDVKRKSNSSIKLFMEEQKFSSFFIK